MHLEIEIRDDHVDAAIGVVVSGIDAHARAGSSISGNRDAGPESDLRERPSPVIAEQEVGHRVIRDEDINKGRFIRLTRNPNWWAKNQKFQRYRFNFDVIHFILLIFEFI